MLQLKGKLGKTITVDDNFVGISQKSMFTGTSEKKIPIKQISSVEVKKPGLMSGYIQIAEIGAQRSKGFSTGALQAAEDENSVLFNGTTDYEMALKIKGFIEEQMTKSAVSASTPQPASQADEIVKFKNLLDQGIITEEEFTAKKKQILGI